MDCFTCWPQRVVCLCAGFLPFSAIYIELYYIFASVWGHKVRLQSAGSVSRLAASVLGHFAHLPTRLCTCAHPSLRHKDHGPRRSLCLRGLIWSPSNRPPALESHHDHWDRALPLLQVYTIYSILSLVFVILIIVTAFITIALTYFQLAVEDHGWWWRSFLCGGSTGALRSL